MAVKIATKQDRRYYQDREGVFRPIENLSISASTPAYPAVLHQTRRTMILADDRSHEVIKLDKALIVSRNDELSTRSGGVSGADRDDVEVSRGAHGSRGLERGDREGSKDHGFARTEEKGARNTLGMRARHHALVGLSFVGALDRVRLSTAATTSEARRWTSNGYCTRSADGSPDEDILRTSGRPLSRRNQSAARGSRFRGASTTEIDSSHST